MNGGVNGTMEDTMESAPNSPSSEKSDKKVDSHSSEFIVNHLDNNASTKQHNHLDNELSQDPLGNNSSSYSENDNSNDIEYEQHEKTSEQTNSNNDNIETYSNNTSESYPDSVTNSKSKFKIHDEQSVQSLGDRSNDGISEDSNRPVKSDQDSDNEVESEEDFSEEAVSESSEEPHAEDTVSINTDTEPENGDGISQEQHTKNNDVIILENDNRLNSVNTYSRHLPSAEIHEIISDNDDCIVTNEEKLNSKVNQEKVQLRRSTRAIKRKRYDDIDNDESDIEEVAVVNPSIRSSKPIIISDAKALVEMAAKQIKSHHENSHKKEPTVVIIDTNSVASGKGSVMQQNKKSNISHSIIHAHNLYQSIIGRGTTVTPVNNKSIPSQSFNQSSQAVILPSLTDDMFVVEAPSFIVPYVYEKPSVKPFREFVDILGKELEDLKAKEERIRQQKEKEEKEKQEKEKQEKEEKEKQEKEEKEKQEKEQNEKEKKEKIEKGDDIEESEEDLQKQKTIHEATETEPDERKKINEKEKKERHRCEDEDDDASWDGESSVESDDEMLSDDETKTVVIKEKEDSIEEIKEVTDITVDKVVTSKSDNYFDCSLGKFFMNIGLNLVQEFVQTDLLKQQNRKLYRDKKAGHSIKITENSIASLMKNLEFSKENNASYTFSQTKCEFCSFKTESSLVMAHHLETPHMKNNTYRCNYCAFEIRSPHDILYHMEAEHNVRGKLERAPAYHQCANCPFEDNGKGKLARHLIPCAKKFKPEVNLAPPIEWEPPAKIPKMTRTRNSMIGSYQHTFNRSHMTNNLGRPQVNMANMMLGTSSVYRPRGRTPMAAASRAAVPAPGTPLLRGGVMVRHNAPATASVLTSSNYPLVNNGKPKSLHQPSISITPLPRQPQPTISQPPQHTKNSFVICEICDGYIKDLEQLRNHMQWIHKVKIHPKMIYNRPPLNCQKCQFRFFTDQGLERHLLGSHGLVTSSMQEAANKGKDAGRCPVCGRVYQWKLLNHVSRDHSLTLKPAHLSYKCTVCTATFGMYKQFENHVYSAHSVVAKRVMDKNKSSTQVRPNSDSLLKPLKINDEITIIPQPLKANTPSAKDK